jgi:hypothetical protein
VYGLHLNEFHLKAISDPTGALMLLLALCNVLLGTICDLWFRISILAPLVAVAFVEEVVIAKHSSTRSVAFWWSAFWSVLLLVATLEMGYLIGVSMNTLWRSLARVRVLRDLLRYGNDVSQLTADCHFFRR